MKRIFPSIFFLCSIVFVTGQVSIPDTSAKKYNNVIGIDATRMLSQFLSFGSGSYYSTYPYMFSYRRFFGKNAISSGIGANVSKSKANQNDTLPSENSRTTLNIGIGFEHYASLSKRWYFYFGANVIAEFNHSKTFYTWSNGDTRESTSSSKTFGVAPLVGLLFKITPRLGLATESSYELNYGWSKSNEVSTPNPLYDRSSKSSGIGSTFYPPTSIIFRIQF